MSNCFFDTLKWCWDYAIGTWEGMVLSTKMTMMMEKYKIHGVIRTYALFITGISVVGFVVMLIFALEDCSTTKYVSYTKKAPDAASNSETICRDVPTSVSDFFYLAGSGYWSTETNYLAKDTLFKTTLTDFTSTEEEFDGYMTELETSLNSLDTSLKALPYTNAIKKIITYRNGSWANDIQTIPFFNVNSIFRPESSTMNYFTTCGDGFSPLSGFYLSLATSAYSYDRAFRIQGATAIDGPIITFSLTVTPTGSAYDLKVALDGSSTQVGDADSTLDDDDLYDMPGFIDDFEIKLDTAMCPPGFIGVLSSDGLVCSLSFDVNVFAVVAAINSGYGEADENLVADGTDRYTTRNYISSQIVVFKDNLYFLSLDDYVFLPSFQHYFYDDCTVCMEDETCSTNDFVLKLVPAGFTFNTTSQAFVADPFVTSCEIFAPLYSGPNTNDDSEECTFDTTYSCYDSWVGDGYCDDANNNDCCQWDGGDCCESTCSSTTFSCGEAGYYCCEVSSYCNSTCSISDDTCADFKSTFSSRRLNNGKSSKTINNHERLSILQKKAAVNSHVRQSTLERRGGDALINDHYDMDEVSRIGMQAIKTMGQSTSSKQSANLNPYEAEVTRRWMDLTTTSNANVPLVDATKRIKSQDVSVRARANEMQPKRRSSIESSSSSSGRRLEKIPSTFTTTEIENGDGDKYEAYEASLMTFDEMQTGSDQYGYISLARGAETSYMCYSRAVTESVHLCPALCNKVHSNDVLYPFNDDSSEYGGFLTSTMTMAHAYDIGRLILEGQMAGKGFIMPSGITFNDSLVNGSQTLFVAGSRSVKLTDISASYDSAFTVGYFNASYLACEMAACYCYERWQAGSDFDSELNTISSKNYINTFYKEMEDDTAHCASPFRAFSVRLEPPVDLLESYFNCKTVQCPDFVGAVGAVLANITTGVSIVALIFSFLITDLYLPKVLKINVEDWRKDDGAYEEAVMSILESSEAKKNEETSATTTTTKSIEMSDAVNIAVTKKGMV